MEVIYNTQNIYFGKYFGLPKITQIAVRESPSCFSPSLPFPSDVPAEPRDLEIEQAAQITMFWKAPANNGGEKIEGYLVEYRDENGDEWVECGNPIDTQRTFDSLPSGGNFKFRVAAYNKIGTGAYAEY